MTNFPTSLDTLNNPGPSDTMDAAGLEHDVQHTNLNDAIKALEAKVGINASANPNSVDGRLQKLERGGQLALSNGVSSGTVTGMNWPAVPVRVFVAVRKPAGGANLIAFVIAETITEDGFDFDLSAETESADYILDIDPRF